MTIKIRPRTIAQQFTLILLAAFALITSFAIRLTYQFSQLSAQGAQLIHSLEQTSALNHELGTGNSRLIDHLHQQFEELESGYSAEFDATNSALAQKYTEYLKLDIGDEERLEVVKIKSLHSELSVISAQVIELLRADRRDEAMARLRRADQLGGQIRDAFENLNSFQVRKLQAVIEHLNGSSYRGHTVIFVLLGALILILVASSLLFKARILGPILSILEASEHIRLGDFSARASIRRDDELGRLAQGFNFMAESLASSYDELSRKVEERTKQVQEMHDQLIQAEKMSAVGQLVSGVAHELNNPLSTIMGFAEIARMECASRGGPAQEFRMLGDIESQAERCRKIVANLLQFSRRQEPHLEAVRINGLVEQVLQLREYELQTRNVRIVRDFDPADTLICADPQAIQQVILNLINNAHDAILGEGRGGTIRVRVRPTPGRVSLEILDDGPGFKNPQRAFEPFYTTKEVGKGTGLGLSVCYGIIKEHGGEITAENTARGARLHFTLPIGDPSKLQSQKQDSPPPAKTAAVPAKAKALVVDDEKMLVRMQVSYLSRMGLEAHGVTNGDEALRYLEQNSVDVVICDVRMPGRTDGLQLYKWVRERMPHLADKVLFASGDVVRMNDGENTGVPCIYKPFRFDEYSRMVLQILNGGGSAA